MKKSALLFLLVSVGPQVVLCRQLVDTTVARVGNSNIYLSDLNEPQVNLGGHPRTLDQCIDETLFFDKAKAFHLTMSEEDVAKRIAGLKKGQGFGYQSNEDYEKVLKEAGLSLKTLAGQVRRLGAIAEMKVVLTPKDFFASASEVEDYCRLNQTYHEEAYQLSFATVEKGKVDSTGLLKKGITDDLEWDKLEDLIPSSALAENMKFVLSLKPGDVGPAIARGGQLYVYRLDKKIARHLVSVDERTPEVKHHLIEEKRKKAEADVIKNLREQASIQVFGD